MLPIGDDRAGRTTPILTITMIALNCVIFFWDRGGLIGGSGVLFADLGMRPRDVVDALTQPGDRFPLVTVFTSLFLHAGIWHLLGNMLFLLTFGPAVEEALGTPRFALYYLFWGIVASATQIFVDPGSTAPVVGASGAIGGVLGCYFLLFPANKIEILVPYLPFTITLSAWVLLGAWFLWQIFIRQEGIANWAHAGGFMAGLATVLIIGGRNAVLRDRDRELQYDGD
jgi:membrane associated rhomboid family serine protease